MYPSQDILAIWKRFDGFPMETLTKAWMSTQTDGPRQRSVPLMKEHFEQYGNTGNCFDLALWLLHELREAGIYAHAVGHDLHTPKAHVAVLATNEHGYSYLCDLGDQWILPILVDPASEEYSEDLLSGFFPAAKVQVKRTGDFATITYVRPNGKVSRQLYDLRPVDDDLLLRAAEFSQQHLKPSPLVERRLRGANEVVHWEFANWKSWVSSSAGICEEPALDTMERWAERIENRAGIDRRFVECALRAYPPEPENRQSCCTGRPHTLP